VALGYRRMRGKDAFIPHLVHITVRVTVKSQGEEGGVTSFIWLRGDLLAQSLQGLIAADTRIAS